MQCIATTKKGTRCQIQAEDNTGLCHVHHPNMTFRLQYPSLKVKTIYEQPPVEQTVLELKYEKAQPPKKSDELLDYNDYQYSQPGDDVPWKD